MALTILTKDLLPVRRDGQIGSTILSSGGGAALGGLAPAADLSLYALIASPAPVDNQLAVWTSGDTIEGTSGLTYTSGEFYTVGSIAASLDVRAYASGAPGSLWDDMPLATTVSIGGIQLDGVSGNFLNGIGDWVAVSGGEFMSWPASAGIAVYAGSSTWGSSITDNSGNWNTAYSWGNHAGLYLPAPLAVTTNHYTGFPNRTDTTISFVAGAGGSTRTLTLSGTNFKIYVDGIEYTIAASLTKQIADVTGLYLFWITIVDGVPTLNGETSGQTFGDCIVATVYWNTTTNVGIVSDERHWMGRDKWMHEYLHETVGARYHTGGAITPTATTFSITECEFYDEDIEHILPISTSCRVLYKNGSADWQWDDNSTTLYKLNGTSMRYNNGNTLTNVPNANYVAMWVYATGLVTYPFMSIIGQRVDNTLAGARVNNTPNSISYGVLPVAETKLLYRIIFKQGVGSVTYQETADYRNVSNLPTSDFTATDHSTLSNLTYETAGHTGFLPDSHLTDFTHANIANGQTAFGWGNWASNFGTTSGKICQGNDSRVNHGETAFGWGNHAGLYTPIAHNTNTSNPHSVTKAQVSLGNVDNESKATMFTNPVFTGNVGVGVSATQKLQVQGGHDNSMIYLKASVGGGQYDAHLTLFAAEPAKTYTGVGISNNWYYNGGEWARYDTGRGGSYIALREDEIQFYGVSASGVDAGRMKIEQDGDIRIYNTLRVVEDVIAYAT